MAQVKVYHGFVICQTVAPNQGVRQLFDIVFLILLIIGLIKNFFHPIEKFEIMKITYFGLIHVESTHGNTSRCIVPLTHHIILSSPHHKSSSFYQNKPRTTRLFFKIDFLESSLCRVIVIPSSGSRLFLILTKHAAR